MRNNGFTLIELLVVIAIIGTLASVVLASLNAAREQARDAKRMSDLQQIAKAMDLYYLETAEYPGESWCDSSRGSHHDGTYCQAQPATGTNWDPTSDIYTALVPDYIAELPVDPLNDETYFYDYEPRNESGGGPDRFNYCLQARLESGGFYVVKNGTDQVTTALCL